MKKFLIILAFFPLSLFSQQSVLSSFNGYGDIVNVIDVDPTDSLFTIEINNFYGSPRFQPFGPWIAQDVQVGMVMWVDCARFVITNVNSASFSTMSIDVKVPSVDWNLGVATPLPNSRCAVVFEDQYLLTALPAPADGNSGALSGINNTLFACMLNHYSQALLVTKNSVNEITDYVAGLDTIPSEAPGPNIGETWRNSVGQLFYSDGTQWLTDKEVKFSNAPLEGLPSYLYKLGIDTLGQDTLYISNNGIFRRFQSGLVYKEGYGINIFATDSIEVDTNQIATQNDLTPFISGTGANGQVTFWTGLKTQSGSNNLFWDNSLSRLSITGLGTQSSTNTVSSFIVNNSTEQVFKIRDNFGFDAGRGLSYVETGNSSTQGSSTLASTKQVFTFGSGNTNFSMQTGSLATITTNGNVRFKVMANASNVVTIGNNDNPLYTLDITGTSGSLGVRGNSVLGAQGDAAKARLQVIGSGSTSSTFGLIVTNSDTTTSTASLVVRNDKRVGILTNNPAQTLHVAGTMRLTGNAGTATEALGRDASGDISGVPFSTIVSSGGGLTGNGVVNYLAQYNSSNTLDTTGIIWTGGRMGIGTATPSARLDVQGTTAAQGVSTNIGYNVTTVTAPVLNQASVVVSAGGNMTPGTHHFKVTYYNAFGGTEGSNTITAVTDTINKTVTFNLPVSTNPTVVGRRIYKSIVPQNASYGTLIATVANNTTTSFTYSSIDPIPNPVNTNPVAAIPNLTSNYFTKDGTRSFVISNSLVSVGPFINSNLVAGPNVALTTGNAFNSGISIANNVTIGSASPNLTTGAGNVVIGYDALALGTTASYNIAIGQFALNKTLSSERHVAVGYSALNNVTSGQYNVGIGMLSGNSMTTGSNNTFLGSIAGSTFTGNSALTSVSNSIFVGYNSAAFANSSSYETVIGVGIAGLGSNKTRIGSGANTNQTHLDGRLTIGNTFYDSRVAARIVGADASTSNYSLVVTDSDGATSTTVDPNFVVRNDGLVGIGTYSPTAKLQINGSGNTNTTTSLNIQNSDGTSLLRVRDDLYTSINYLRVGNSFTTSTLVFPFVTDSGTPDAAGTNLSFYNYTGANSAVNGAFAFAGNNFTQTSGNHVFFRFGHNFFPISGNATYSAFTVRPSINQTGGANGITRGFHIDPNILSAADWRSIEWSNSTGYGLYGAGTANNYLAGSLGIGSTTPARLLHVQGEARISDLTTDTPTRIVGADADGDLGEITLGSGLSITSGVLNTSSTLNTGSGTTNYVTKWTGTNTIGNSQIFDDGTNVGIGTTTMSHKLTVNGDISLTTNNTSLFGKSTGGSNLSMFKIDGSNNLQFGSVFNGANALYYTATDHVFYNYPSSTVTQTVIIKQNGNLGVGVSNPSAKISAQGLGNTSTSSSLLLQNSDAVDIVRVRDDRYVILGSISSPTGLYLGGTNTSSLRIYQTNNSTTENASNHDGYFIGSVASTNSNYSKLWLGFTPTTGFNTVSGNPSIVKVQGSFIPTSGTSTFSALVLENTINQTGGANGISRGLFVNPNLTLAADWRSIEWNNSSGFGLYGTGTAPNLLNGRLFIPTGSYDNPSLSFVGDANTGLYRPVEDNLELKTGTNNAIALENQATNLKTYSENFTTGGWNYQNITVTIPGNVTAPDGTSTANLAVPNTTLAQHRLYYIFSISEPYTLSVYAKSAGYNFISFGQSGGVGGQSIIFDIVNGTISGSESGFSAQIENVGNGWFRCSLTKTSTAAATSFSRWIIVRNANSNTDYAGDGTSGVYLWGHQLETGLGASSYVRTDATTITRPQAVSILGPNVYGTLLTKTLGSQSFQDLSFTTQNATRMTITNGGNVGIGTTAPSARLHVVGAGTTNGYGLIVTDVNNNTATASLVVQDNGRVGIGTNAPSTKLDVIGDVEFQNPTTTFDGGTFGTELLTTGSGTGWTGSNYTTGYTHSDTNFTNVLTSVFTPTNGTIYRVVVTCSGRTVGTATVTFGGKTVTTFTSNTTVTLDDITTSTAALVVTPSKTFNGTITASVKLISVSSAQFIGKNSSGTTVYEERLSSTNIFQGVNAGRYNTTGTFNIFQGQNAGRSNTIGVNNIFQGADAGLSNTTGNNNIFQGINTGRSNTSGFTNIFQGQNAGFSNTTGAENIFQGFNAGYLNTTGYNNIFQGKNAGYANTTGYFNVFQGSDVGKSNTTGNNNIFQGTIAGQSNTTGSNNLFQGTIAGGSNTTGSFNIFQGSGAAASNRIGSNNVVIGYIAGRYVSYGTNVPNHRLSNSILIGYDARTLDSLQTNQVVIGYEGRGLGNNTTRIGNSSTVQTHLDGRLTVGNTLYDVNTTARIVGLNNTASTYALVVTNSTAGTNTTSAPALVVTNTQNVGIGTYSPLGRLDIVGTAAGGSLAAIKVTNLTDNAAGVSTRIELPVFNGNAGGIIEEIGNSIDGYRLNIYQGQASGTLSFGTGGNNERMRINSAGNVGIGNSAPQKTLHVTGEVRISDLDNGVATRIVGATADGDLDELTLGSGLSITSGTISVTNPISASEVFIESSTATTIDLDANTGVVKDVNGTNASFTLPTDLSRLNVYKNGIRLARTGTATTRDFSVNTGTNEITFTTALLSTDRIVIVKI